MSAAWLVFVGLLLVAAVTDARSYRIPNWVCVAVVALFAVAAPIGLAPDRIALHVAVGVAVFGVGYLLYALTGMGAGDAKLGAAIAIWVGPASLQSWLTYFALAMLVLAFVLVGVRRAVLPLVGQEPAMRILRRGAPVPLGLALAASAILASPGFDPGLWIF